MDNVPEGFPSSILDGLPLALLVTRAPSGTGAYANAGFRAMVGVEALAERIEDASALYGMHDLQGRLYPIDRLPFSRVVAERVPVTVDDMVIHRPDGARVFVRAFAGPLVGPAGEVLCVTTVFTDITEEVRARREQRSAEQQLAFAIHNAPVVMWMTDAQGIVTASDGAALRALGFAPGQLVGVSVFELYRDYPNMLQLTQRALAGEVVNAVNEIGSVHLQAHIAPIRDAHGQIAGTIGLATDITEGRRLEKQVVQHDRVRALGMLAASVAHEINNPLTYILGNLDLAQREIARLSEASGGADGVGRLGDILATVRDGAERVRRITLDLRSFTRPDDRADAVTDVSATLRMVAGIMGKDVGARARLSLDVETVPAVRVSEAHLVQVLVNLLANAAQALPAGSPDHHEVAVAVRLVGDRVIIEVSDTGPGVPEKDRERIFEPFVTTKAIGDGTGLGLFVCRNVIRGAGGEISVHDRAGGGALFRVALPVVRDLRIRAQASPSMRRSSSPDASARRPRVLVVDDDRLVASALSSTLSGEGYSVVTLHDGHDALRFLLADDGIDLAYCDVMMKGTTGVQVYEGLATQAPEKLAKLVLMTGGVFSSEVFGFVEQHRDLVLEKPFDIAADARKRLRPDEAAS